MYVLTVRTQGTYECFVERIKMVVNTLNFVFLEIDGLAETNKRKLSVNVGLIVNVLTTSVFI